PFEPRPHLAAAVSGGADSTALLLLAHQWASERGGRITTLTVDHGLRPEARAEAQSVARLCAERGIEHHILTCPPFPGGATQEEAREARYGLLTGWCRERHALHLLLAHHRDDQAE